MGVQDKVKTLDTINMNQTVHTSCYSASKNWIIENCNLGVKCNQESKCKRTYNITEYRIQDLIHVEFKVVTTKLTNNLTDLNQHDVISKI